MIRLTMAETASRSEDIVDYEASGDNLSFLSLFIWLRWKSKIYLVYGSAVRRYKLREILKMMFEEVEVEVERKVGGRREIDVSLAQSKLYLHGLTFRITCLISHASSFRISTRRKKAEECNYIEMIFAFQAVIDLRGNLAVLVGMYIRSARAEGSYTNPRTSLSNFSLSFVRPV